MSNSGVTSGFSKCFILFMAIVILLQGCGYCALAITGIIMKNCNEETTDIAKEPLQFAMDLIYFASEDCGGMSVTVSEAGFEKTIDLVIDWTKSFAITNRLTIFLYTYLVVSALWVITSVLVVATICGPITKMVTAVCFWPWFLIVIGGSILDAVATGYHINDIVHTTTATDTFDYVGVSDVGDLMTYIKSFEAYFITPAVIMTCVSSRVVLIWLLNIFGTGFCLSISRVLAERNAFNKSNAAASRSAAAVHQEQTIQPAITIGSEQPQAIQVQAQIQPQPAEVYATQIKPKPLPIQIVAAPQAAPQAYSPQYDTRQSPGITAALYPSAPSPDVSEASVRQTELLRQMSGATTPVNNNNEQNVTYRPVDSHPDRLNYPVQSAQEIRPNPQPFSAASPLNNRYSSLESTPQQQLHQQQQQRVSDELRSQLPWSYTSLLAGKPQPPPVPRKPQQLKVYPEIPEPDYTKYD